jgi:HTH-type transcriptional regulator/antitoxin HipB
MTSVQTDITSAETLGAAIREARDARGWLQADLAHRAGVSRALVIDLERGARPRAQLDGVLAVLRALGKSVTLVDDRHRQTFEDALDEVLR